MAWQTFLDDDVNRPNTSVGGTPGNNWLDAGSKYSVENGKFKNASPSTDAGVARPSTNRLSRPALEATLNQRVIVKTGTQQAPNNRYDTQARINGGTFYTVEWSHAATSCVLFRYNGDGTRTSLRSIGATMTAGVDYLFVLTAEGASPTTLNLSVYNCTGQTVDPKNSATWGTLLFSMTPVTDSTAALQSALPCGFAAHYNTAPGPCLVDRVWVLYDAPASLSADVPVLAIPLGNAQTVEITGVGTNFTGSPFALDDTLGEAAILSQTIHSPTSATLVINPGTTERSLVLRDQDSGARLYLPAAYPTITLDPEDVEAGSTGNLLQIGGAGTFWTTDPPDLSASEGVIHSVTVLNDYTLQVVYDAPAAGGQVTFTDASVAAEATLHVLETLSVDDPVLQLNPNGWELQADWAQTQHAGNGLRVDFTGTKVYLGVDVSMLAAAGASAGNYPKLRYRVDEAPWEDYTLTSADSEITLESALTPGAHRLYVNLVSVGAGDRWLTPIYVWRVTHLKADGQFSAADLRPYRLLVRWDSIGEGTPVGQPTGTTTSNDAFLTAVPVLAAGLDAEVAAIVTRGHGYTVGSNQIPALYTPGDDAESSWNKYRSGVSRLEDGLYPDPAHILINVLGVNDRNTAAETVAAAVAGWLAAERAAAPDMLIFVVIPPGRQSEAGITAGWEAYQAATPDPRCYLLDLGTEISAGLTGLAPTGTAASTDSFHPRSDTNARIGALIVAEVRKRLSGQASRIVGAV